jgi:hypothetical protein
MDIQKGLDIATKAAVIGHRSSVNRLTSFFRRIARQNFKNPPQSASLLRKHINPVDFMVLRFRWGADVICALFQ